MLEKFFDLKHHGTNVPSEIRAGFTSFLTMVYIVPTNAIIMSKTGMPFDALITATALVTIFSTILIGIMGNAPIAISVGMGLNAYFTFGLVLGMKIPWESALAIVAVSGFIFLFLTAFHFREWVLSAIPKDLRTAMGVGIGSFLTFIALHEMGIVVANPATLVSLGDFSRPQVLLGVLGIFLTFGLFAMRLRAAFLISIVAVTVISFTLGYSKTPTHLVAMPASIAPIFMKLDFGSIMHLSFLPAILAFVLTDLFDSLGTLSTAVRETERAKDQEATLSKCLKADAITTALCGFFGTSTTTTFIESIAGIKAGGKTGLTAIVTGLLFITTLFFLPIFRIVPVYAVAPVLVAVGASLFANIQYIDLHKFENTASTFIIVMLMTLTYSITNGLAAGFLIYFFVKLSKGEAGEFGAGYYLIALLSFIPFTM